MEELRTKGFSWPKAIVIAVAILLAIYGSQHPNSILGIVAKMVWLPVP
jgi:hypothetical protein